MPLHVWYSGCFECVWTTEYIEGSNGSGKKCGLKPIMAVLLRDSQVVD